MAYSPLPVVPPLVGTQLKDGWTIVTELPRPGAAGSEDQTGGYFSVGCIAERTRKPGSVEKAFIKVIDIAQAVNGSDHFMVGLKKVTDAYASECNILAVCKESGMDRVIQSLDMGEIPPQNGGVFPIPYIIFEFADGDLRKLVSREAEFDVAWKLRVLHDVAVGLMQIHNKKIAHHDLKPSNVLVFNDAGEGAKIGDLGSSSQQGVPSPNDENPFAGARAYAPPELAYGELPVRWEDRHQATDIYHLGSLTSFLLAGVIPNGYFRQTISKDMLPLVWGGSGKADYATALPFLEASLTEFVNSIKEDLPDWGREELATIILNTCCPNYATRGDPDHRSRVGMPLGIEAFVSRFDRLSRRALVHIKK